MPHPSTSSSAVEDKQLFILALCDEFTGTALRPATESDLAGIDSPASSPPPMPRHSAAQHRSMSLQEILASRAAFGGPSCSHCGVTESPQWRRGPAHKPLLCNACGTRYRRTNQFLPLHATPGSRKRATSAPHTCAQENALEDKAHTGFKQPRLIASTA
ncbi:CGL106 [Auxenochlorella protothecoides x Auxenochlorella symbiontica]